MEATTRLPVAGARTVHAATSLLAAAASAVVAVSVLGTVAALDEADPGTAADRLLPGWVLLLSAVGAAVVAVAAWLARRQRPGAAAGLAAALLATALPVWSGWSFLSAEVRAVALSFVPLAVPAVALAAGRCARDAFVAAGIVCAGGAVAVHLLAYDPFSDPGCARTCRAVAAPLEDVVSASAAQTVWGAATLLAAGAAAAGLLRGGRVAALQRAGLLSVVALATVVVVRAAGVGGSGVQAAAVLLGPMAVVPVALLLIRGVIDTHLQRVAVDDVVHQLEAPSGWPGRGRGTVHFAVPGEQRWIDAEGDVMPPAVDAHHVVLTDASGPAVRLVLPPRGGGDEVLAALTPARRLALENARLTALARLRLAELQASQRRVVSTADVARRHLERDLHDGAQQRLVSAALHLGLARARAGPNGAAEAQVQVHHALEQLRRICHGAFPDVLLEEGLVPAVEELALEADSDVALDLPSHVDVTADVARAAYAVVEEAIRSLGGSRGHSRVELRHSDDVVTVRVVTQPPHRDAPSGSSVADRVGALGGSYGKVLVDGTTVVTAVLPCE